MNLDCIDDHSKADSTDEAHHTHVAAKHNGRRFYPHWGVVLKAVLPWCATFVALIMIGRLLDPLPHVSDLYGHVLPLALGLSAIVGFCAVMPTIARWWFSVLVVYPDRLVYQTGVFRLTTSEVLMSEISNLQVEQTQFQRMLGYGDMWVDSRASWILSVIGISDVQGICREVREYKQAACQRV